MIRMILLLAFMANKKWLNSIQMVSTYDSSWNGGAFELCCDLYEPVACIPTICGIFDTLKESAMN